MIIHNVVQGSDEWLSLRLGIPTASEFSSIVTPKRLELAKEGSVTYMHKLVAEWLNGAPLEEFVSPWQERGKVLEPEAVADYEFTKEMDTQPVGFVTSDDGMVGASPDRLVGEVGLYEGKAPGLKKHVSYMIDPQSLLADYRIQHQGQLWVCKERSWVDMHSHHPGFPSVIVRTYREEAVQDALEAHIPAFVQTMLAVRAALVERYGELRRERTTGEQRLAESRAAFDAFIDSPIGGNA